MQESVGIAREIVSLRYSLLCNQYNYIKHFEIANILRIYKPIPFNGSMCSLITIYIVPCFCYILQMAPLFTFFLLWLPLPVLLLSVPPASGGHWPSELRLHFLASAHVCDHHGRRGHVLRDWAWVCLLPGPAQHEGPLSGGVAADGRLRKLGGHHHRRVQHLCKSSQCKWQLLDAVIDWQLNALKLWYIHCILCSTLDKYIKVYNYSLFAIAFVSSI